MYAKITLFSVNYLNGTQICIKCVFFLYFNQDFQYSTDFYGMYSAELGNKCLHLLCLLEEGSLVFNEHCCHIVKNDLAVIPMPGRVSNLALGLSLSDYRQSLKPKFD